MTLVRLIFLVVLSIIVPGSALPPLFRFYESVREHDDGKLLLDYGSSRLVYLYDIMPSEPERANLTADEFDRHLRTLVDHGASEIILGFASPQTPVMGGTAPVFTNSALAWRTVFDGTRRWQIKNYFRLKKARLYVAYGGNSFDSPSTLRPEVFANLFCTTAMLYDFDGVDFTLHWAVDSHSQEWWAAVVQECRKLTAFVISYDGGIYPDFYTDLSGASRKGKMDNVLGAGRVPGTASTAMVDHEDSKELPDTEDSDVYYTDQDAILLAMENQELHDKYGGGIMLWSSPRPSNTSEYSDFVSFQLPKWANFGPNCSRPLHPYYPGEDVPYIKCTTSNSTTSSTSTMSETTSPAPRTTRLTTTTNRYCSTSPGSKSRSTSSASTSSRAESSTTLSTTQSTSTTGEDVVELCKDWVDEVVFADFREFCKARCELWYSSPDLCPGGEVLAVLLKCMDRLSHGLCSSVDETL